MDIEVLSVGSLTPGFPSCKALVLVHGRQPAVIEAFRALYPQSHGRMVVVEDPTGNLLVPLLEDAQKLDLPCIVLYGRQTPPVGGLPGGPALSLSLLSQGALAEGPETAVMRHKSAAYFAWLGFQSYLCPPQLVQSLQNEYFEIMRLGTLRANICHAEPLLRAASHHFIDLRAVRRADSPHSLSPSPNGLYAEELCTLARYAGMATTFRTAFLYGYPAEEASLVAQTLWFLTEGLSVAPKEDPLVHGTQWERKVVQLGEDGQEIAFLHASQTDRWWMEIPNSKDPLQDLYIPCSTEEYLIACRGEVPTKWLFYYQKSNDFL